MVDNEKRTEEKCASSLGNMGPEKQEDHGSMETTALNMIDMQSITYTNPIIF